MDEWTINGNEKYRNINEMKNERESFERYVDFFTKAFIEIAENVNNKQPMHM